MLFIYSFTRQVVAREVDTPEKRSSSATVLLQIQDMNDNAPAFRSDSYDLHVKENARIGTVISQITVSLYCQLN